MSAHSPGPWRWEAHPDGDQLLDADDNLVGVGVEDARLIAAAPELFRQLRWMMALAERIGNSMGGLNPGALESARALIARLEG